MREHHKDISTALEDNFQPILDEYLSLKKSSDVQSDYQVDDQKLHSGRWDWQSYVQKGTRKASFAASCPKTVDVLEGFKSPRLMTGTPLSFAFFSTMGAGAEIRPHFGPSNLRIRCHFPLVVPKGDLGMVVGGKTLRWEVGKPLFFDDSYEHHVWNNTASQRVVLLFDLWHPDLEEEEIVAIQDMFGFAKEQGWSGAGAGAGADAKVAA
jgi:aspartyl/asparaginyl beta-hydroxylase (cupin superfamily)